MPRHQQIIGRILGYDYSLILTKLIGISEIIMAIWIVSSIKTKFNAIIQIIIIAIMNTIEFLLVLFDSYVNFSYWVIVDREKQIKNNDTIQSIEHVEIPQTV